MNGHNPDSNPDWPTHLRMWIESGFNPDWVNPGTCKRGLFGTVTFRALFHTLTPTVIDLTLKHGVSVMHINYANKLY